MLTKTTASKKTAKTAKLAEAQKERYFEAVGRRKTAVARVRIYPTIKKNEIEINNRPLNRYFPLRKEHSIVNAPFDVLGSHLRATVVVKGGGLNAQAEAVRLAIARALTMIEPELRPRLKILGFLRRDPRMVERKKYGSRKARRPQQWRKR